MDHQRKGLIVKAKEAPAQLIASVEDPDFERGVFGISLVYLDTADEQEKAIHLELEIGELIELSRITSAGLTWHDECRPASYFIAKTISDFANSVKH